jgi:hypothetical protein
MDGTARSDCDALLEHLDERHARLTAASADVLEAIAALDASETWSEDDESSLSCFLAARLAVRAATAREWVRVARKLRELPRIREAHASAILSWDQIRPLTRFATTETDEQLSIEAPNMTVPQLYREAARHEKDRKKRVDSDQQLRSADLRWTDDGRGLQVEAWLPGEQGARFEQAVRQRAQEIERDSDALDPHAAQLADALEELVTSSGGDVSPVTLVVHADAKVLTGESKPDADHLAETESGVQLSEDAVRRIACDAKVEWVLEADGRPVGIGRRGRIVRGALRRAVLHREGGMCAVPGCERRNWLHAHHLTHWADGGPTNIDNLVTLCSAHHRRMHKGGWTATGVPGRDLRFHDPGGRVLTRASPSRRDAAAA